MKLICAPMATLSHEAFRRSVEIFGACDEYYTEMINAGSLLTMGPFEKYYILNGPVPNKIVWQLTGNKIDSMIQAAAVVSKLGGIGIDINMGCSAPQIYQTGAGISWMLKPIDESRKLVRGVKQELSPSLRLSVKLRLGDEDFTDESFFGFCDMLVEEGVSQITLHARTKKEKYRLRPKWEYVEKLALRQPGISVILNGDVNDGLAANEAMKIAPHSAGLMIARKAAQCPWIFSEVKACLENRKIQVLQSSFNEININIAISFCEYIIFVKRRLRNLYFTIFKTSFYF
ncbi:MAG: tRNA-dihydrouridine synthase family protein [Treponema sp.]|nr:tRNA-dihydrouridine synthase family protein [Treponema sp.]